MNQLSETSGAVTGGARSRGLRLVIVALGGFAGLGALWLAGLIWFAAGIPRAPAEPTTATDAIVVLTGGAGRLGVGFELLREGRAKKLFISGVYRFALIKNEKLELGPALGVGYVNITSGLRGELGVGIGDETASVPFDTEAEVGSITGDIGGYLYWWPGERFLVRGDARYIAIGLEEADAAITEGKASLTWFPWRKVGFGVQYAYTKFLYERNRAFVGLGGTYQYDGLQFLVNVAF